MKLAVLMLLAALAGGGLLILLAAFLAVRLEVRDRTDWRAARGEVALLGLLALGLIAGASHAAAVEPGTAAAIAADVLHLAAAGVWVGGLAPLALLLHLASREAGADARPYAVLAARRFSRAALAVVLILISIALMAMVELLRRRGERLRGVARAP